MSDCEHDWRLGSKRASLRLHMLMRREAVCIKCWTLTLLWEEEAEKWPEWTEELYWEHLDAVEGDRADEIRAMKEKDHGGTA